MKQLWFSAMVAAMSVTVVGCGRDADADFAEDADESATVSTTESALTSELADEVAAPMSASADQLATNAVARVPTRFKPQGCATAVQTGATVVYTLTNCTGPFGLVKVNGTLTAIYSRASAGGVNVVITGKGVKANDATIDINSVVVASQSGGVKTANVTIDGDGTGPRGNSFTRKGAYVLTYDTTTECLTVDGTWQTGSARVGASTVVSGYKRCKGACPSSGGSIVHTSVRDEVVTVTYDGSANAKYTATRGTRAGTLPLRCGN